MGRTHLHRARGSHHRSTTTRRSLNNTARNRSSATRRRDGRDGRAAGDGGRGDAVAGQAETDVIAGEQVGAVSTDGRVHGVQLVEVDARGASERPAAVASLDLIEAVAVRHHAGLDFVVSGVVLALLVRVGIKRAEVLT